MLSLPENASVEILKFAVTDSFRRRFRGEAYFYITTWEVDFPRLDGLSSSSLERPFTEEEIFSTLKDIDGDKAPGPYGFSFKLVQSYWHVLKADILGLFHSFHSTGEFDPRFSESFISLIPKVKSPASLNDFRPISVLGWVLI